MSLSNNPIVNFIETIVFRGLEPFGRYYSKYRAWVSDNDDPENLHRLKLIIPTVAGVNAYNYWAHPNGVFSGDGYGMQCLPKKGDMVWVEFEGGRPEVPIWTHGHFAQKELPKGDEYKDKDSYWLRTPKGNWIMLYDTKNFIHIENVTGNQMELNEKGASIISKKHISLGKLNKSTYKAVLGEPNEDVLKDINTILKTLHEAMVKDLAIYASKGFTNMVTAIPQVIPEVQGLKTKIDKILSKLVTLEKE